MRLLLKLLNQIIDHFAEIVIGVMVLAIIGAILWAAVTEPSRLAIAKQLNSDQIADCKRLGGFAMTDSNGWLRTCTFPPK